METSVREKLQDLKVKLMSSDISKSQLIRRKNLNARIQMLIEQSKLNQIKHETAQISDTYREYKLNENQKTRQRLEMFIKASILCILVAMIVQFIFGETQFTS
jgi:hypothetical protein